MKGRFFLVLTLIFFLLVGFAAANTVLDITGIINVAENIEDFKIEITNLKINNSDSITLISKDKQSFTFTGSGNDTLEYTVTNYSYQYDANISLICTPSENIVVEQISNLPAQSKNSKGITSTNISEITCAINVEKISRTDYAEETCISLEGTEWTFDYIGAEQEFTVPCDGNFKIEAWGAQGGTQDSTHSGGYGAYAVGEIKLNKEDNLYINIGGAGKNTEQNKLVEGGYNGGGSAYGVGGSGGGCTHIATITGLFANVLTNNVFIVSGGGGGFGGFSPSGRGGNAGGIKGENGGTSSWTSNPGIGGTQTSGGLYGRCNDGTVCGNAGKFGIGGGAYICNATHCSPNSQGGGGAGYYGGGSARHSGAGGGSSYIGNTLLTNKAMYCYSCAQSSEESTKTISTTCTSSTPTANCAKQGNGYAKITYLGE